MAATIIKGETNGWINGVCSDANGVASTLASVSSIELIRRNVETGAEESKAASVVSSTAGTCRSAYSANSATAGTFDCYWKVTYGDASIAKFPAGRLVVKDEWEP